jgi:DNA-binding transcriptional LysR family regulator
MVDEISVLGRYVIEIGHSMLDLNALARFAAVVERGGFSPAARALGLPRQSVHRSVVKLEEQAGVRLLERSSRHLRPTDAGRRLFEHANEILRQAMQAQAALSASSSEVAGVLRLTTSHLIGEGFLLDALPRFLARWPRVSIDAHFTVAVTDLLRDDFDVAIRAGTSLPPSMFARRLGGVRAVCCATPDYLAGAEPIPHPFALAQHPALVYGPTTSSARWHFERAADQVDIEIRPRLRSDSAGVARQACLAHQGILKIPRFAVHDELANGALVEVCADWRQPETPIWAVYPSRSDQNLAVGAFLAVLRETLAESDGL